MYDDLRILHTDFQVYRFETAKFNHLSYSCMYCVLNFRTFMVICTFYAVEKKLLITYLENNY